MGLCIHWQGKVYSFLLNNSPQEVLECQAVVLKYLELTMGN
jgi:hypothetical protein